MSAVTNFELFEELFNFVKKDDVTLEQTIKEFGGSSYYIPSYKTTCRNEELLKEYEAKMSEPAIVKKLAKKYDLSEAHIYLITKPLREPALF